MKKKIQISAVELKALSEVIVLDSSFVAKAVRAADAAQHIKTTIEENSKKYIKDEDGNCIKDQFGKNITEIEVGSRSVVLQPEMAAESYYKLISFVEELCNALIGEDE